MKDNTTIAGRKEIVQSVIKLTPHKGDIIVIKGDLKLSTLEDLSTELRKQGFGGLIMVVSEDIDISTLKLEDLKRVAGNTLWKYDKKKTTTQGDGVNG